MFKRFLLLLMYGFSLHAAPYDESTSQNITPTARTCPDLNGVYITGEFIYWKARGEELIFTSAFDFNLDMATGNVDLTLQPYELEFQYDPGFKIGLGGDLPYDGWDLYVNWTHFYTNPRTTVTSSEGNLATLSGSGFGAVNGPPSVGRIAKGSWDVKFNAIDFDWGRRFFLSETLILRTAFGGKVAWLDQDFHFSLEDTHFLILNSPSIPETLKLKNDYWGIGPYASCEVKWIWRWGVGLLGKLSGAVLWGKFDQEFHQLRAGFQPPNLAIPVITQYQFEAHRVRPTAEIFLGLDWEWCFIKNWLSVQLRVGYESQYFWSQILNTLDKIEISDLTFEGLTIMGRIDF